MDVRHWVVGNKATLHEQILDLMMFVIRLSIHGL